MRRSILVGRVLVVAARRGVRYRVIRRSYDHAIWECGGVTFAVPWRRHLSDGVAAHIRMRLEPVFGEEWWR